MATPKARHQGLGKGLGDLFARTDDEVLTRVLPQLVAACEGRPSPTRRVDAELR